MPKILQVIDDLNYGGAARQLALLALGLSSQLFQVRVAVLGTAGPIAEELRAAGIDVVELGRKRMLDLRPIVRLRTLLRDFSPEIVHTWGRSSLRFISVFWPRRSARVVSAVRSASESGILLNCLDPWFLRRADRVVARGAAEANSYRELGVSERALFIVPPAVAIPISVPQELSLRRELNLSPQARLILCVGPFRAEKGFVDAIMGFLLLSYLYEDLHLVLIGDGPDCERLRAFRPDDMTRVHFAGIRRDVASDMEEAEVIWVPARETGGINVALEAAAVGRPVVAANIAELREHIEDGLTGLLVPRGDNAALAKKTRLLLENANLRHEMGMTARQRVRERYEQFEVCRDFSRFYKSL